MRTVSKSATFLATESVNSAPFKTNKRGETKVHILARKSAKLFANFSVLARKSANFFANFSATKVTSLPSFSLSLSLSLSLYLSLSPSAPHAQYRKRFRASYNTLSILISLTRQMHLACFNFRGVAIGGSGGGGGSDEPPPPHGPEKVRKNRFFFFFFFLSGIAQESIFVEKDERTPPTENKSCKTRHGQVNVRMALRQNTVVAKENQP